MRREAAHFFFLFFSYRWMGLESQTREKGRRQAKKGDSRGAGPCGGGGPVSHTQETDYATAVETVHTHTHMYPAHSTSTSRSSRMISLQHSSAAAATQVVVLFIIFLGRPVDSLGSCKEAGLCCTGRDASCVVQKTPQNAIIEDLRDTPCYCDHACLKLNDCCPDYRQTCGGSTTIYLSYCPIFSRFY